MFFDSQPNIFYPTNNEGLKLSKNLFRRVRYRDNLNALYVNSSKYTILEGETPEAVSFKRYGSTEWYWTILLLNNIIDLKKSWPCTAGQLDEFIDLKYKNTSDYPRHWETKQITDANNNIILESGIIVELCENRPEQLTPNYFPDYSFTYTIDDDEFSLFGDNVLTVITNREYEYINNENKKEIFVINGSYLTTMKTELENLFKYETNYKIDENGIRLPEI
jgi:hypothetical protein